MKIVDIFANKKLHAFHYDGAATNELDKLLDLWNDTGYLYSFLKDNEKDILKGKNLYQLINDIITNANAIDDILFEIANNDTRHLEEYFKPLHNQEYKIVTLSLQKGKNSYLRLYAIRIDYNCFVITGGAIKFTHLMEERTHSEEELKKLNQCRDFLKENGVVDSDSFFEFLNQTL